MPHRDPGRRRCLRPAPAASRLDRRRRRPMRAPAPEAVRSSAVHRRRNSGRQRLLAGGCPVDLQQVRRHLQRARFTERTRIGRRHRLNEVGEQLVHRSRSPFRDEVRPRNSRRITRSAEIGRVASGTLLRVRGLSGLRLGSRVGAGRNRLSLLAADGASSCRRRQPTRGGVIWVRRSRC